MSKYKIISIAVIIALASVLVCYMAINTQIESSPTPKHSIATAPLIVATNTQPSISPTPSSLIATNTTTVIPASTLTTQPIPDQILQDKARLLKLVTDCQVESMELLGSWGGTALKITLRDGSSFLDTSSTNREAASFAKLVRDKCPIKIFIQ